MVKSKLYRGLGLLFAVFGLLIFIFIFSKSASGDISSLVNQPFSIIVMFSPFIPAAVFSFLAGRHEKKYLSLSGQAQESDKDRA